MQNQLTLRLLVVIKQWLGFLDEEENSLFYWERNKLLVAPRPHVFEKVLASLKLSPNYTNICYGLK